MESLGRGEAAGGDAGSDFSCLLGDLIGKSGIRIVLRASKEASSQSLLAALMSPTLTLYRTARPTTRVIYNFGKEKDKSFKVKQNYDEWKRKRKEEERGP